MIESYRGFVNAWECDENNHLNVQFYVERFEIMARQAFSLHQERWPGLMLRTRHIRYHQECHTGDTLQGETAAVDGGSGDLFHLLRHAETGVLLATAVDGYLDGFKVPATVPKRILPVEAAPRGLSGEPEVEQRTERELLETGMKLSYAGIVGPNQIGPDGLMGDRYFIARVTDAIAQAWSNAGITPSWLETHGLGRVAVEMKLTILMRPSAHSLIRVVTSTLATKGKIIMFRLCLVDGDTGAVFATTIVSALLMNLTTRRAVDIPADVRSKVMASVSE